MHLQNADGLASAPHAGPGQYSSEGTKWSQRSELKRPTHEGADKAAWWSRDLCSHKTSHQRKGARQALVQYRRAEWHRQLSWDSRAHSRKSTILPTRESEREQKVERRIFSKKQQTPISQNWMAMSFQIEGTSTHMTQKQHTGHPRRTATT